MYHINILFMCKPIGMLCAVWNYVCVAGYLCLIILIRAIMSFKQFLAQQDDNIDDTEAVQKYAEYKKDVKRRQLQLFFDKHKEEEW